MPAASSNGLGFASKNHQQVWGAMDGRLGKFMRDGIGKQGPVVLARIWDNVLRQTTFNLKPIRTPDDLRGTKVRLPSRTRGIVKGESDRSILEERADLVRLSPDVRRDLITAGLNSNPVDTAPLQQALRKAGSMRSGRASTGRRPGSCWRTTWGRCRRAGQPG